MVAGTKVGIVGNMLFPFNEAYANQARVLAELFDAKVFTCNDIGWLPFKKFGRYFVVNSRFVMKRTPILSILNGLLIYIALKTFERKFDTILLMAGIESEFLKSLNLERCVPLISTIDDESKLGNFVSEVAPKLKKIVVQSKKVRNKLISSGVDSSKIYFMYPIINANEFRYTNPPPLDDFRILFASAPNVERQSENNFEAKGVPLLLKSFKDFIDEHPATLYLLWRGKYIKELWSLIKKLGLEEKAIVVNKVVDMMEWYAKTHITVIPYISSWRSPQLPLSALESLSCGRPVVTTDVIELAEFIRVYKCGCVAKPLKKDFVMALKRCKVNYWKYQRNCRDLRKVMSTIKVWTILNDDKNQRDGGCYENFSGF